MASTEWLSRSCSALKESFYYVKDSEMGWGARTASGVEVYQVDFHHLEILREPHVRIFGEELGEYIERVTRHNADLNPPETSQISCWVQRLV